MKKRSLPVLAGYRRANFRSLARFGPAAYDLLIALDVSLIVVEIQAVCHLAALRDEDYCASPGKRAQVGSAASLLIYIMQTCRAVRMSLLDDNDISARILARSISEACDMLIVTQSDHEFALRYANSDDDFRFFWHSEIAKEKLQRRKRAIVGCFFESDHKIVSDIEAYQRAESEAFSRATHPAYIAGIMYAFQILHEKKGTERGWEFLGRWMGERSAVFVLDSIGLSISKLLFDRIADDQFVDIAKKKFRFNAEGVFRHFLSATISCGAIASRHHEIHGR